MVRLDKPTSAVSVVGAVKLLVAVTPLFLTLLLMWLLGEGRPDLGAGSDDMALSVPLLLWSFWFFVIYCVLWWRRLKFRSMLLLSCALATACYFVFGLVFWTQW